MTTEEKSSLIQERIQAVIEGGKELDLSNLGLNTIPEEVFSLRELETLKFMNNKLVEVPYELTLLRNLKNLYLYNNQISGVSRRLLIELPYLNCLDFGDNPFDYYEAVSFYYKNNPWQGYAECVKEIEVNNKFKFERFHFYDEIKIFPKELYELKHLESIGFYGRYIKQLPDGIGELENLQRLDLDGNKLSELPSDIVKLSKLESISLNSNKFREFPSILLEMPALKRVFISNNKIKFISPDIIHNKKFTTIFAVGNPIKNFSSSLFNYGLEEMRERLRS